ncbi:ABC transporter ATP-binding protein [Klebsiella variicola]|uniref:ABC transporter ATP-binding protein n=1 Tax=Klebsiella variicola TaxID=244366 RepID=UPI0023F75B1F|nr:ABC transporter ATP-binding protein [Klebsiella variicola]MDF7645288.1 ABC transporter ATP-binding protein [Klebsiella variicola]
MKNSNLVLEVKNVSKFYKKDRKQKITVLEHINLEVKENEIVALLGRSGSGKSTLLRMAAGLVEPDLGTIVCCDLPVNGPGKNTSMVFQSFALFPWLNVFDSVAFGLQAQGLSSDEVDKRTMDMLDLIGLTGYEKAYPRELSGGMRQRVGFARALAVEPDLLLMDEPFSALDIFTGNKLRQDLIELWEERVINTRSMLLVTHSVEEAVMLSDRVCLLGGLPSTITDTFDIDMKRNQRTKESISSLVEKISTTLNERIAACA